MKAIVVPTDGSKDMEKVLKLATEIARGMEAKIYGLYVVDLAPFIDFPEDEVIQALRARLYEEGWNALRALENFCKECGVPCEVFLEEGRAGERIIKFAKKVKASLIVMGTRRAKFTPAITPGDKIKEGLSSLAMALSRKIFGSTAEKVIASAHCPVLALPLVEEE